MEHVEEAGIHSGDSSCVIPPFRLPPNKIEEMATLAKKIAVASHARGHFNIQMAVMNENVYVLEANPRASRTVPFLAKALGLPLVEWGMRAALGEKLDTFIKDTGRSRGFGLPSGGYAVKTPVFPFSKFKNVDPMLGPEMRSTGEVMGMDATAGGAFAKAFLAAGIELPVSGSVLFSVQDADKTRALGIARIFQLLGFKIIGTPGTADFLSRAGVPAEAVAKIGQAPLNDDLLAVLKSGKASLIVNTTGTLGSYRDGLTIRKAALKYKIPLMTTLSGAEMASLAIQTLIRTGIRPVCLQDFTAGTYAPKHWN
jgi:carbamoyl-phosphate synthase large subunit